MSERSFETTTSQGNLLLEPSVSGIAVSLSEDGKLFKAQADLVEFVELDAEEQDVYLQMAAKKISFDTDLLQVQCRKIMGIPAWKTSAKRVPLTEADKMAEELTRAHERIDELELQISEMESTAEPTKLLALVKFQYTDGVLEYSHNASENLRERYDSALLAYFKNHTLGNAQVRDGATNAEDFYERVMSATTFDQLQKTVLKFSFVWEHGYSSPNRMGWFQLSGKDEDNRHSCKILWQESGACNAFLQPFGNENPNGCVYMLIHFAEEVLDLEGPLTWTNWNIKIHKAHTYTDQFGNSAEWGGKKLVQKLRYYCYYN